MKVMLTYCLLMVKRFVCVGFIYCSHIENIKTTLEPIIWFTLSRILVYREIITSLTLLFFSKQLMFYFYSLIILENIFYYHYHYYYIWRTQQWKIYCAVCAHMEFPVKQKHSFFFRFHTTDCCILLLLMSIEYMSMSIV